jgi:hypothetical protein
MLTNEAVDQYSVMHILVRLLFGRNSYICRHLRLTGQYLPTSSVLYDSHPANIENKCPVHVVHAIQVSGFAALAHRVLNDKGAISLPSLVKSLTSIGSATTTSATRYW